MAVVAELLCATDIGVSFGNYELDKKAKLDNFEYNGDIYKVKTFKEITKLEKNGMFVYESVPGTTVHNFHVLEKEISFQVEGLEDPMITLELEEQTEYKIYVNKTNIGTMKTNFAGKLNISVELTESPAEVRIIKL